MAAFDIQSIGGYLGVPLPPPFLVYIMIALLVLLPLSVWWFRKQLPSWVLWLAVAVLVILAYIAYVVYKLTNISLWKELQQ